MGVALGAERPFARGAFGDEYEAVVGARCDEQEPPGGLPGAGVGEARGADLGAVGGCPAAGGDLSVGVSVGWVEAGEVEGGAVEEGQRRGIHSRLVDAGEGRESRDGLRGCLLYTSRCV